MHVQSEIRPGIVQLSLMVLLNSKKQTLYNYNHMELYDETSYKTWHAIRGASI